MRIAMLSGTVGILLLASGGPALGQSSWTSVASRGDAERDLHTLLAAHKLSRGDCRGALREAGAAGAWYDTRPGVSPDSRISLTAARANTCLGDTVTAALNYAVWYKSGVTAPEPIAEFGQVCRAVFRPAGIPDDSASAALVRRGLEEDRLRLSGAVTRLRPGVTRDSVRTPLDKPYNRWVGPNIHQLTEGNGTLARQENFVEWTGKWYARDGRPTGNRSEYRRLNAELERTEAQLGCLKAAWP